MVVMTMMMVEKKAPSRSFKRQDSSYLYLSLSFVFRLQVALVCVCISPLMVSPRVLPIDIVLRDGRWDDAPQVPIPFGFARQGDSLFCYVRLIPYIPVPRAVGSQGVGSYVVRRRV